MFGRKNEPEAQPGIVERPGAKGRPTPTRREAEAKNKRPIVPPDRKAAARAARDKQRELRARQQEGMLKGEEKWLPTRDKGPVRRYTRDIVDARLNIIDFLLPTMLVVFIVTAFAGTNVVLVAFLLMAMMFILVIAIIDTFLLRHQVRKRLRAKFGRDVALKGISFYAIMRASQIRPLRMPKPQVKYRQYPS